MNVIRCHSGKVLALFLVAQKANEQIGTRVVQTICKGFHPYLKFAMIRVRKPFGVVEISTLLVKKNTF